MRTGANAGGVEGSGGGFGRGDSAAFVSSVAAALWAA